MALQKRVFILSLLFLFTLTGLPVYGTKAYEEGFREAAGTGRFILLVNDGQASIALVDKADGYIWRSSVPDEYESFQSANPIFQSSMKSMFTMEYINISARRTADAIQTNPLTQKAEIHIRNITNGVSIAYDFKSIGISMTLDVWLEEDSLNVRIPAEGIREEGEFAITEIELMPFFGAAQDMEAGYLFYPDGSGGLHYFEEKPDKNAKQYDLYVYGTDELDPDILTGKEDIDIQPAMLPVYGVKKGEHAFLAIIGEGEYDACITASPSGNKVDLNRIYPGFTFRRKFKKAAVGQIVEYGIEKEIIAADRSVKFMFLKGEDADYSGMANLYREHLIKTGKIRGTIGKGDGIPLGLDLFMGIKEKQILMDKFIKMTTFPEAEIILKSFEEYGVKNIDANLIGWVKGGYGSNPVHMPPEGALGGQRGLTGLLDYTKKQGIRVFLQDNYVEALNENGGFSKRNDIAYHKNNLPVADLLGNWFLLNPVRAWLNFSEKILGVFEKYAISGINFERFGKLIYYDHNEKYPVSRAETAEYWNRFFEKSREGLGYTASQGGNLYVLKHTDRLYEIPYKDNGHFITDRTVPFYQMVVHGSIPYSSDPGNLSEDLERLKLKWVEYGYMPGFQLAYRKADKIKYTSYNRLFTSEYTKWMKRASDIYLEFNDRLLETWSSFMVKHEEIRNNVFAVTYENGCRVYINYNQGAVTVDGHKLEGMDYLVVTKEGIK